MAADTETRKSSDRVVLYTMVESIKEAAGPQ